MQASPQQTRKKIERARRELSFYRVTTLLQCLDLDVLSLFTSMRSHRSRGVDISCREFRRPDESPNRVLSLSYLETSLRSRKCGKEELKRVGGRDPARGGTMHCVEVSRP